LLDTLAADVSATAPRAVFAPSTSGELVDFVDVYYANSTNEPE
jgi:hypothetical protein